MNSIEASNKADSHLHSTFSVTLCNTASQRLNSDYSPFPQTSKKKKDSLPEKVTMTLPIIGESTRWGFPAYDGCTLLSVFLFGCVGFFHLYKNIHSSSLLWIESSEIPF